MRRLATSVLCFLLSDRVLIAGDAEHMAPARLFTACLTELGFTADIADCMATSEVTPHDALVVFDLTGSESPVEG